MLKTEIGDNITIQQKIKGKVCLFPEKRHFRIFELQETKTAHFAKRFPFAEAASDNTQKAGWRSAEPKRLLKEGDDQISVIDLHSHICPGVDDGSKSVEMSIEMLQKMAAQGVTVVCATSHYYANQNSVHTFCDRRNAALQLLYEAMPQGLPKILPGAEVAYFPRISEKAGLERLCIAGTKTLMLEMPFCEWNSLQVEEVHSLVLDRGLDVVLVHPERFCFSKGNKAYLEQLAKMPLAFQLNAEGFLHWRTRKQSLELLRMTKTPLMGSDSHNLTSRAPNLGDGRKVVARKLGEEFLAKIDANAARLTAQAEEKV